MRDMYILEDLGDELFAELFGEGGEAGRVGEDDGDFLGSHRGEFAFSCFSRT